MSSRCASGWNQARSIRSSRRLSRSSRGPRPTVTCTSARTWARSSSPCKGHYPARDRDEVDERGGGDQRVEDLVEAEDRGVRIRASHGVDGGAGAVEEAAEEDESGWDPAGAVEDLGERRDGNPAEGDVCERDQRAWRGDPHHAEDDAA